MGLFEKKEEKEEDMLEEEASLAHSAPGTPAHKEEEEKSQEENPEVEETIEESVEESPAPDGYRRCTCGNLVPLPSEGDDNAFTICSECGVKHIR